MTRLNTILKIMDNCQINQDGCMVWQGGNSGSGSRAGRGGGYGRIYLNIGGYKTMCAVHRVMYVSVYGYVPNKVQIDHKCRNRLCCNPYHLEAVTHKENQRRKKDENKSLKIWVNEVLR